MGFECFIKVTEPFTRIGAYRLFFIGAATCLLLHSLLLAFLFTIRVLLSPLSILCHVLVLALWSDSPVGGDGCSRT